MQNFSSSVIIDSSSDRPAQGTLVPSEVIILAKISVRDIRLHRPPTNTLDRAVLIMDVARFKYPPHWVPLSQLFVAMKDVDPASQRSRGYVLVSSSGGGAHVFSRLKAGPEHWKQLVDHFCRSIPALLIEK